MNIPPLIARYVEAYNAMDVAGMLACLADSVHFQNLSGEAVTAETKDKDQFAELARFGATAFRSRTQTVTACITVGHRTMLAIDYEAVVARDLPNGWAEGQHLAFSGASYFECEGGKITRIIDQSQD
jgi:hypothetical protein